MINLIAHRDNTRGRLLSEENLPRKIEEVTKEYYAEIDVWFVGNSYWLGHDKAEYQVSLDFLRNAKLFCHAKNIEALHEMLKDDIHCFWHEQDYTSMTSKGFVWKYPEVYKDGELWGICSDWL